MVGFLIRLMFELASRENSKVELALSKDKTDRGEQ